MKLVNNAKKFVSPMEMAHFRFGMIAPVIQGTFSDASAAAYYRRVTATPLIRPDGTEFQYSPDTLERWTSAYRKHGMDGLTNLHRKDKGVSRKIDSDTADEILNLLQKFPHLSAVLIHEKLIKSGFITGKTSVRAVQRFIKENDLRTARNPDVRDRMAFEMSHFGELWQADTAYFPHILHNGKKCRTYCVMILDDYSRMIVGGELFFSDSAASFQKVLKDAVNAYGIPRLLYMDNGSPYRNAQLERILDELGIVELHTRVRDGASKGKVERNFRTVRQRFLADIDPSEIDGLDDFNERLRSYIHSHNTRVHSGTKETPMARFINTKDFIRLPESAEWVDKCFLNRITRKVRHDSCVSINSVEYDCHPKFIGMTVEIRYTAGNMDSAYISYNGKEYPIKRTDKAENAHTKRGSRLSISHAVEDADGNIITKGQADGSL